MPLRSQMNRLYYQGLMFGCYPNVKTWTSGEFWWFQWEIQRKSSLVERCDHFVTWAKHPGAAVQSVITVWSKERSIEGYLKSVKLIRSMNQKRRGTQDSRECNQSRVRIKEPIHAVWWEFSESLTGCCITRFVVSMAKLNLEPAIFLHMTDKCFNEVGSLHTSRTLTPSRLLSLCAVLGRTWGVVLRDSKTHAPTQLPPVDLDSTRLLAL